MDAKILERAKPWMDPPYDTETRQAVQRMAEADPALLADSFYTDLEFGTGGLRGVMGPGTNRMNRYTVGMATQGLANYILEVYGSQPVSVAVAHDSRINSAEFARVTAEVFSANGIQVYLFPELRPTPQLSFAIRELGCVSGVVVTASHNPKEYNGYKVYWNDGAQIVEPHDERIIAHVRKITSPEGVKFTGRNELINSELDHIDRAYRNMVLGLSLSPDALKDYAAQVSVVYTSLHGTGMVHIPHVLQQMGFTRLHLVKEQHMPNGNFPTVVSPNPEERVAMEMALELGRQVKADLVMGTDPDSDRVGLAIRNEAGELELINGNEAATLLVYYLLRRHRERNSMPANPFVCKTIVTTDLIDRMCEGFGVPCFNTLTGFKHIASVIREQDGKMKFIGGGEESYGYMVGDAVRDKDAVASAVLFAEMCAWARSQNTTLRQVLNQIHLDYGLFCERLLYLVKKGQDGAQAIAQMMERYRQKPPQTLGSQPVVQIADYKAGTITTLATGDKQPTNLPKSNVLQFVLADGSKVTARPSGTEPKIKFYVSLKAAPKSDADLLVMRTDLNRRIDGILAELDPQ